MRYKKVAFGLFMSLFILSGVCYGHGVKYLRLKGGVGIEAKYSDGMPLSFSSAKVFSPGNPDAEFQTGYTDKNGRFMFFPDMEGIWKVEINDGMGHGVVTNIDVGEIVEVKEGAGFTLLEKILIGIAIIWGITGTLFYIAGKRYSKE